MSYLRGVARASVLVCGALVMVGCGDNIVPADGVQLKITAGLALRTTEAGGTATFTVGLTAPPAAPVTITLTSSDVAEGTVSPASVRLTADNFADGVTITVTGVDDAEVDGDVDYAVQVDGGALGREDVSLTNMDDDASGSGVITVTPTTGLVTTEAGGTATFTVVLAAQPTGPVTIPVATTLAGEGTAAPATLAFTQANWNTPQTVTVTGADDAIADGDQPYMIVLDAADSTDPRYAGVDPADVALTNTDDDTRGVMVSPATLQTSEAGTSASFTVVLRSEPTADVTIALTSGDLTEGTVTQTVLTFTAINWNAPHTVTVTGVDDSLADGDVTYAVVLAPAASADTGYAGIDPADVVVRNLDDDTAGVIVTAPAAGLTTSESGLTDALTIVLRTQPTAAVTIPVMSTDPTEGTTSVSAVTFTTLNWDAPQQVVVTGQDDAVADGAQAYTIVLGAATSTDADYAGLDPADVAASNLDNDTAGIRVTPLTAQTDENGASAVFTIVLLSQPTSPVTIPLTSGDLTEGTVTPSLVTFTATDWDQPQSVTVTGVDDLLPDGNQVYAVVIGAAISGDAAYAGMDATDVTVTNVDNDSAGITVDPVDSLLVSEFGDVDTFDVVLNSQPTANVTIAITSSDPTEGTVSTAQLTFTPANWNIPQTITVTGQDDALVDGNVAFTIITGVSASTDPAFNGINPPDVGVTNVDNETPNVFVKARKRLFTGEQGGPSGSATFRVRLTTNPAAPVTCTLQSDDTTEGVASPATLVFNPNQFGFQTVTVTGIDDAVVDGDVLYTIVLSACTSADGAYNGLDPRDVAVINRDNE